MLASPAGHMTATISPLNEGTASRAHLQCHTALLFPLLEGLFLLIFALDLLVCQRFGFPTGGPLMRPFTTLEAHLQLAFHTSDHILLLLAPDHSRLAICSRAPYTAMSIAFRLKGDSLVIYDQRLVQQVLHVSEKYLLCTGRIRALDEGAPFPDAMGVIFYYTLPTIKMTTTHNPVQLLSLLEFFKT